MTLIKTALKNIKKDILLNTISVLQLTAALIITVIMISSIYMRYQYYTPFKDYFEGNGVFCIFTKTANSELTNNMPLDKYISGSNLHSYLHSSEGIAACNQVFCSLKDQLDKTFQAVSYNDEIIDRFTPALSEGRWLNNSTNMDCIEIVVSENDYGWRVGDQLEIDFYNWPESVAYQVEVVGVLQKNSKVPGGFSSRTGSDNFNLFYSTYSFEIEEVPLMIFPSDYLSKIDQEKLIIQGAYSSVLIKYPDDFTGEQLIKEQQILSELGCEFTIPFQKMSQNNKRYLYAQLYTLLPIISALFVMVVICGISISALATKRRLRDYTIYSICGMQWRKTASINFIQSGIIVMISGICTFLMFTVLKTGISNLDIKIEMTWTSVFIMLAICIFYLAVSMLMPLILIHKNTPKQLLNR